MATVVDTYSWGDQDDRHALKAYLEIQPEDTTEDSMLEPWYTEALRKADEWLDEPFVDSLGVDVPHPPGIIVGVWEYVKAMRDRYGNRSGAKSVKTGQLSETYGDGGYSGAAALKAAMKHWWPHKRDITVAGMMHG